MPPDQAAGEPERPTKIPGALREPGPSEQGMIDQILEQGILAKLSDKHRQLLQLRLDGATSAAIAEALGYKDAHSVDVTLERLRRRIEADLGPEQASVLLGRGRFY